MKKGVLIVSFLITGLSSQSYASKGYAHDGLNFMLAVAGLFLVIAGLLSAINFLKRNGRTLVHRTVIRVRWAFSALKGYLRRWMHGYFGLPLTSASS